MKIDMALAFIDKKIAELEQQLYVMETVMIPRYESDKQILRRMRDQRIKMQAMKEKIIDLNRRRAAGEQIAQEEELTAEELASALPESLR